jgi:acyl-CoA synthetase (AMP-forming)/AMP-acid ligase II
MLNTLEILQNGITIASSGTSGQSKEYFQSPEKLRQANLVAITAQRITPDSKIYTCCSIKHAGGLLAQTLPGRSIGAQVDVVQFNAYRFVQEITNYTHTHLTPLHARAIMLTKGFDNLNLSGIWVTCGADPVSWDAIDAFVARGATFMVNWGMTEVGPIAINTVFDNLEKVNKYKQLAPPDSALIGDVAWCQYQIVNQELLVKGPICVFDDWYSTKDRVVESSGILYYLGRTNKEVDLWTPRKG